MSLNTNQLKAVQCIKNPCLVLAGAGSGKTKVITNKIIYLMNNDQFNFKNIIVALTFTNKAAKEMKTRVYTKAINYEKKIFISTFHNFGMKIIQSASNLLKIKTNFLVIDEFDRINIIKKIMHSKLKYDAKLSKNILIFISTLKNNCLSAIEAQQLNNNTFNKKFLECYFLYEEYLKLSHFLDFDDLIYLPIKLFQKNQKFHLYWKKKIKYLLVDEYQDTNSIQYNLIKLITKQNNFTLVGDDDQSIYSWRGANPNNLFLLKKDFPDIKIIKLEENYRSSGRILNIANNLISHNPHVFRKKLFSNMKYGPLIKIISTLNEQEEAKTVLSEIIIHRLQFKTLYSDYAILYRSNNQSKIFEKYLIEKNIPYYIFGKKSICNYKFVKILIFYLKIIINPEDNFSFLKIINIPNRGIGKKTIAYLNQLSDCNNTSLYYTGLNLKKNINDTLSNSCKQLNQFCLWIQDIRKYAEFYPNNVIKKIIDNIQYIKWVKKNIKNQLQLEENIKNILILVQSMKKIQISDDKNYNINKLSEFITSIFLEDSSLIDDDQHVQLKDKICLMTLHASKGLEFSFVFIIGIEDGILPHKISLQNNDCYEERRLFYVGITRAKKELTLTYTQKRISYGNIIDVNPSRFLLELPKKDLFFVNNLVVSSCIHQFAINKKNIHFIKKMLKLSKKSEKI
ncbi:ATP-dependent DNA helicase Rep [Buchnera aphidicola (Thelaxes suberi)]|uniref:UvrD-helicase domain-containing protein n=1 Tax=Buchnera aphidicola TaxID=9 RepID=UPI00346390AE